VGATARVWFAATALVVTFGLLVQVLVVVEVERVIFFDTAAERIFNVVNAAVVASLYLGVASVAHLLDRRLARGRPVGVGTS
jgi:hypothetical protein